MERYPETLNILLSQTLLGPNWVFRVPPHLEQQQLLRPLGGALQGGVGDKRLPEVHGVMLEVCSRLKPTELLAPVKHVDARFTKAEHALSARGT